MKAKAQTEARLMRFPNIKGNNIVFTYAGDLYLVSTDGGVARRLTSDVGFEMFAKFSPDGKYIAFTAQYDGNTEVYVMPADGGNPQRLTFTATLGRDDVADRMGPNNIVMGWTPDSKKVIFRSRCYTFNDFRGQLFTVDLNGGMPEVVPIQDGGFCSFSPDGKFLAFNKIFREFRTWKYYQGGMADDIWIYDYTNKTAARIFQNTAQDIFPMWYKDKIYFASDRDRIMNLFVYDTKTKEVAKVTNFDDYDVKFPSIGDDKIVFEKGGFIYYYSITDNKVQKVTVEIKNDFNSSRSKLVDASKLIRTIDVSPKNDFMLMSARGDIFKVPVIKGVTKDITLTPGVHERNAVWSPDGNWIAYIGDKTGEFEVYLQKADLSAAAIQLTTNTGTYIYDLKWSPDSKKVLFSDRFYRLRFIDISTKKITEVAKSAYYEIEDFNWSPDSRWVTYSLPIFGSYNKIMVFDSQTGQNNEITDGWYPVSDPVFSDDGKYLLFASGRSFSPTYDDLDWNVSYNNLEKIYFVLLKKDTPNPLAPTESFMGDNDENTSADTTKNQTTSTKGKDKTTEIKKPDLKVDIDFDGIKSRLVQLPVRASNYYNIYCVNNVVYYNERYEGNDNTNMYMYNLKTLEEKKLATDVIFYIPWSGKKMLLMKNHQFALIDLPTGDIDMSKLKYADLTDLQYITNYRQEYQQIFDETWRQMRDYFYDPNMHGVDWKAIYNKYNVLVPYVNHRNDLTYILGEMIGELNIGHAYVGGGERPEIKKVYTGLLGGLFSKDATSGYFRIDKIMRGASWSKDRNSPLANPGLNVKEGDYIIAINGVETKTVNNIYQLLVNTAGKPTELLINSKASATGARKIIVEPLQSEAELYYYEWVQHNIDYVSQKTNGQIGYIHIPDMSSEGMNEFVEYFYPQFAKKGLIIDDRGNGGGNVSPIITEILKRQMAMQQMWRNNPMAGPVPEKTNVGPKVLLIDEYSASDGDLFPFQFKYYKIGKVIGKRTWGGVTGIRGSLPFIDGGTLSKPEFGHYSADGTQWIIEGHGVDPDIEIDNNPAEVFQGKDAQLDKAIEVILEDLKNYPEKITPNPPFPDKSGKIK